MAVDKLVDSTQLDADLTSVANAIRTKGGTSAQLAFPNGFISAIQNIETGGDVLTNEVKQALLQIGQKVAYIDDQGQQYYNDLMLALYPIQSISAVYTQSGEVYTDDTLDALTADLVVTATYDGGTTEVISAADYVLSGSLATAGTQTITVSYMGKTTTFSVTVTAPLYSIPDFAAQTISSGGKSATVKKENGVYTISGNYSGVAYIYPDGTVSITKPNTLWFSSESDKPFLNQMIDVFWSNPGSTEIPLQAKLSQSDATGNLASAIVTMTANSSGLEELAEYSNDAYPARNFSAIVLQFNAARTYSVSASLRIRIFSNGVRYL